MLLHLCPRQAVTSWVHATVEGVRKSSASIVERELVGATLVRRFRKVPLATQLGGASDAQSDCMGDFAVNRLVYQVRSVPSGNVLQGCAKILKADLHPVLIIPQEQEDKARILAQDEGIDEELTIISLEDFVAFEIIELATDENKELFTVFRQLVEICNKRLSEVETDLSLQIEVR
ncbi:MAG: DUF4928 family protein [Candidatus Hydrogenedentes bacterium]|nr:DUF4928 family protein [Candidatus Hydrogenedentota bacterium]